MSVSQAPTRLAPATLIRRTRLVPVGMPAATDRPVDIRIRDGVVQEVAAALPANGDELVVDADGRWVIPGLWDQHVHMGQWAMSFVRLDVSGTAGPQDVARIVGDHLTSRTPASFNTVVAGFGYRSATWSMPPTVAELDAVSGSTAVVLASGDGHNGWLNSKALELFGLPPRDGALDEYEWFPVFERLADLPGAEKDAEAGYPMVVANAAARGVVGIRDFEFGPGYRDWPERFARGIDQLRVRPAVYPDRLTEVILEGLSTGQELPGGAGLLSMGPLKIISDGSLNSRTAFCCESYSDADSCEFPLGKQNYPTTELVTLMRRAHESGLEIALHAIGDAAVGCALDAFAVTGAVGSIEHAQLMTRKDITRMGQLGVQASVQPAHLLDDRDVTEQCWPDRTDRCFPLRSLMNAGVTLAMGSDAPVARLDPWLAMAAAVHRSAEEREPWNPTESLTAADALAASTDGQTTVAPGSRGDVVLLDHNPLQGNPDSAATARHLREMPVAATFLAGRPTHLSL